RVRETVQASLSAEESERLHAGLLQQLEIAGRDDSDWLHALALGACQRAAAFRYGMLAAERASETLAFERAAELYSRCLVLFNGELELYTLWLKLAHAQAHCRRGYDAAKAYSSAAEHAPADKRPELLQLSAAHLVRSGRFEEGERMIQRVLKAQKMRVPKTRAGLFTAIAWEYCRIALRSLDIPAREASIGPTDAVNKAILYGTLSIETQLYAPLRSGLFQARALRLGLDYGSSTSVARALCLSAAIACVSGTQRAARRSDDMLKRAEQLFKRTGNPELQLELLCARAVCAQFIGNIEQALEPANAVEQLIESRSSSGQHGDYYYMYTVRMVQISALQSL
ncbi:MAG TPA: hypothetical protein VMF89_18565, partial [Polyangiales bacterium]|nr:hypothetical protein [Polyangiales bacterium]